LLPAAPFVELRINARKPACLAIPNRSRLLETAFHSFPTTARCRATIEKSKFLACSFAAPLNFALNSFGLLLTLPSPVCPRLWRVRRNKPVVQFSSSVFHLVI